MSDEPKFNHPKTMPDEIEGVPIIKKSRDSRALAIGGTSGILVNTNRAAMKVWNDPGYMKRVHESGWLSSPHENHHIWHELGHTLQKNNLPYHSDNLSNINKNNNTRFAEVASKVSKYATTNGHEFLSEVYAGNRAGMKFGEDVNALYKHLKGPEAHAPLKTPLQKFNEVPEKMPFKTLRSYENI